MVNGFGGFLANTATRQSEDDPVRRALAVLGVAYPGEWYRTDDWAARVAKLGLMKVLIPAADQDTADGRIRGTGVVLSNHAEETLVAETEDEVARALADEHDGDAGRMVVRLFESGLATGLALAA